MRFRACLLLLMLTLVVLGCSKVDFEADVNRIALEQGQLEGILEQQGMVRSFKGIPFAAPPVADLRWQPPQAAKTWQGIRNAKTFGNRCMQNSLYSDM